MRRITAACVAMIALGFLLPGSAEAGWVIHSRSTGFGGKAEKEVSYIQRDVVRTEASGSAHVMNFASRKIIMGDEKERKYSVMTFEEFKRMVREGMKQASQAVEEMKRQGIPVPGQTSRPAGKISVSRIPGATIAGYACDGYRVSTGGTVTEEIWVTGKIDLSKEFGPGIQKEFEELAREAKSMGFSGVQEPEDDPAYRKIFESGYLMKMVHKGSGYVQEVTRVEKKAIAASLFEEPKGYKKVPFDKITYGSSEGMPAPGEMPPVQGQTMPRDAETPRQDAPAGGVGGQATEYGKQTAEEAKDAASRGAQEPVQEKKKDVLDSIQEGAKEGIKKLFKW